MILVNSSSNGSSYEWIFENGQTSQLFLPSTEFDTTGSFAVSLITTSDEGCTDTLNSSISIEHLPVAQFNIPNPEGCFPIMVGHYNQSAHANSFTWDFGDGTSSEDVPAFHLYETPGAYTVSLIASNNNGCADTLIVDSAVVVYPRPIASFNPILTGTDEGNEFFMKATQQSEQLIISGCLEEAIFPICLNLLTASQSMVDMTLFLLQKMSLDVKTLHWFLLM